MDGPTQQLAAASGCLTSLAIALAATPLARRIALSCQIVDRPDGKRKLQRQPVALLGGVAVLVAVLGGIAAAPWSASFVYDAPVGALSLCFAGICLLGVYDDACNLRARWKFAGQLAAVVPLVYSGLALDRVSFAGYAFDLGAWGPILTVVWLAAAINAVNLIDGMDGLASTTGLCAALGAASLAATSGSPEAVVLALVLAGALAGFLVYNLPPATIYLGDAGSMLIGLAAGVLALLASRDTAGRGHVTLMIVLLAVPIGDVVLAIVRRGLSGKGIWVPDRGHIHHRLLERGFPTLLVLGIVASLCLLSGGIAVWSRVIGWDNLAWLASVAVAAGLIKWRLVGHHEWLLTKVVVAERWSLVGARLPLDERLAALPFEVMWERLQRWAHWWRLAGMHVSTGGAGLAPREREWNDDRAADAARTSVIIDFRFDSPRECWCRLRLTARPADIGRLRWKRLTGMLQLLGQFWAEHPDTIPINVPSGDQGREPATIPIRPAREALAANLQERAA